MLTWQELRSTQSRRMFLFCNVQKPSKNLPKLRSIAKKGKMAELAGTSHQSGRQKTNTLTPPLDRPKKTAIFREEQRYPPDHRVVPFPSENVFVDDKTRYPRR